MKRLNLWLRELSLSQQLLAIIILFVAIFALFLFTFLSPALDSFSEAEMYQYLHNVQDNTLMVIEGYEDDYSSFPSDSGYPLTQGIYDEDEESFTMIGDEEFPSYLQEDVIENVGVHTSGTKDLKLNISASQSSDNTPVTMLYCMTLMKDGRYLVSVIDNAYRMQFRSSLINSVITMNVLVVAFLFVLLMLWVSTLIVPLNQIKTYINKVKNNEPAELNVHRSDAIGEVADALTDMQAELARQSREKQEMVQNISHDLKTPIATIQSYGEAIKDGVYPYDTLEKSVDVIIEHADRLQKKVQSLIMLNKMDYLEDDGDEDVRTHMNPLVEKVMRDLSVIRPEIELLSDAESDVYFHGMEDPWRIVVENLIDNGLRYAKSHIRITLREDELCVINDGSSIAEEDLERIFHPYEMGTNGKFGLGLSIVHKVCTTYGYHVDAENLPGEVCFRIWRNAKKGRRRTKHGRQG